MTYTYPNSTTVAGMLQWANTTVDGWLGVGMVISLFIIVFYVNALYPAKKAGISASFFAMIVAIILYRLQLVNPAVAFGTFILFIVWIVVLFVQEDY